eukprot:scaffold24058_cov215-Cylindrotheca_fusiformis.AAC.1
MDGHLFDGSRTLGSLALRPPVDNVLVLSSNSFCCGARVRTSSRRTINFDQRLDVFNRFDRLGKQIRGRVG